MFDAACHISLDGSCPDQPSCNPAPPQRKRGAPTPFASARGRQRYGRHVHCSRELRVRCSLRWLSPSSSAGTGTWAARGGLVWYDDAAASDRAVMPVSVACGSCKTGLSSDPHHLPYRKPRLRRAVASRCPKPAAAVFVLENEWCSLRAHERKAMSEEIWRMG